MNFKSDEEACAIKQIPDIKGRMSWFMAIIVAMFYSQHSRAILSTSMDNWNIKDANLDKFLKNFFNQNLETGFNDSDILDLLYETNPEIFIIKQSNDIYGVDPLIYIGGLYDLLNIKYRMFEFNENTSKDSLVYSLFNKEYNQHISKNFNKRNKFFSFELKKNSKILCRFNPKYGRMKDDNVGYLIPPKKSTDTWKSIKRMAWMRLYSKSYKEAQLVKNQNFHEDLATPREYYTEEEICNEDNLTIDKPNFNDTPPPPILIVNVLGKTPVDEYKVGTSNRRMKVEGEGNYYTDKNYLLNRVNDYDIHKNITSMKEEIKYMGEVYVLDSVILYNDYNEGHKNVAEEHNAVGITCNNEKYIYNALDYKKDKNVFITHSAQLIRANWDINKQTLASWEQIVRDTDRAERLYDILHINKDNNEMYYYKPDFYDKQFSYNFNEGHRILIYVKKNNNLVVGGFSLKNNLKLKKTTKSSKKSPEGKVLNPKTGRYILIKNKPSSIKIPTKKSAKKPPEGKV
jgi:hypothetical protein